MASCIALLAPAGAAAATIDVSTTDDQFNANASTCSLREAIWAANNDSAAQTPGCTAGGGDDTINVPAGTYGLIRSGANENAGVTGDLDVTSFATIQHSGPGATVVDAKGVDRAFETSASGGVTISGLTIQGGHAPGTMTGGGGVLNSAGSLTLLDSTLTANISDDFGGGFEGAPTSTSQLINSTVSGNQALNDGGGVDVTNATVSLLNVTVTGNVADADENGVGQGGGVGNFGGLATAALRSTLVAGNTDRSGQSPDCFNNHTLYSQGQTLIGSTAGCAFTAGPGDLIGVDATLGPLADNGGPTFTHALLAGSPAIGRGAGCAATDQRGVPRSLGGACDIGAFELVRCAGRSATRIGTVGHDQLIGTAGRDVFLLLGGKDTASGLAGGDLFCGGAGNDIFKGGPGGDKAFGQVGNDKLKGGPRNDKLIGGADRDRLIGGAGADKLRGGGSSDRCNGGAGDDVAFGCERSRKVP